MGNWRRWLRIGLAGTILLAVVAFILRIGTVEDDLTQRVASRLADEGHVWASVVVTGRDVTITGTAPTTEPAPRGNPRPAPRSALELVPVPVHPIAIG